MSHDKIVIKGAKVNNLKNIDLEIPRDKMTVITGLSGSGKSSLAFDTIYAEGQRRYVESLSSYARQFLGQMDKPDVESIEGMSPAISIDQKTTNRNPRSTVGTVTEIYDYLRLLFAKIGVPYCPVCGKKISALSVDQMIDKIMEYPDRTRVQLLAPLVKEKKGQHKKLIKNLQKEGFTRIIVDGEMREVFDDIDLDKNKKHSIDLVVDRLIIKEGIETRLADSLETALRLGDGFIKLLMEDGEVVSMSSKLSCPDQHVSLDEINPRTFSFNSPEGMCQDCNGIGFHLAVDPEKIIPDESLSLNQGAVEFFATSKKGTYYYEMLHSLFKDHNFSPDQPLSKAPDDLIDEIMYGTGDREVSFVFDSHFSGGKKTFKGPFEGVINNIERRYKQQNTESMQKKLQSYMKEETCSSCHGKRLNQKVLSIKIEDKNISDITDMAISDSLDWFKKLKLKNNDSIIGEPILKEIRARLQFLEDVGLGYLTLSRYAMTLSGGESQRIRLATQIGSGLVGVVYVLDEPSIGLHQRDNQKLLKALRNLTDMGNTLIIVEHDEETMIEADHIVDIGPGAGLHGGEVVAQGTSREIMENDKSITGQYLSGKRKIPLPTERKKSDRLIKFTDCHENNLKHIDVSIPLGVFTCVTGVSGSGKSSLVNEIIYKSLAKELNRAKTSPGKFGIIEGIENLDKVINIDQSPIGRTPRSNPATYTKVFDLIREVFAMTPEAKMRGYGKGRFSFNVKGGRCETCKGDGTVKVEMHFLPDVYVPCEVCSGKRYNRETLQVTYKGKNISDVLDMTVEEALDFFENHPPIRRKLQTLYDVGLGYIKLGQPSTQMSGGEAQRVKLATELSKRPTGKTIYILDEPTTGLHSYDVQKLILVLQKLVQGGNSLIVIEHNLDVIKTADYIIDLGPEGGKEGGFIVAIGTPEEVSRNENSYTGKYLRDLFRKELV